MRRILFLSVMLFLSATVRPQADAATAQAGAAAQSHCDIPADEEAIRRIPVQWKDGYNSGNAAKVASLYAKNASYLTQHFVTGIIQGRAAIKAYVQRGVDARYHIDSIEVIATGCSGSLAYAIDRYESTNAGQKAMGVNLVVLRKTGGRWFIVAHEAAVPDPATAVRHLDVTGAH